MITFNGTKLIQSHLNVSPDWLIFKVLPTRILHKIFIFIISFLMLNLPTNSFFSQICCIFCSSTSKTSFNQTDINNFVKRSPFHIEICIIDLGESRRSGRQKIIFKRISIDSTDGWVDGWMEKKITMCVYLKNIKNRPKMRKIYANFIYT